MFRKLLSVLTGVSAKAAKSQAQVTPRPDVLGGAFAPGFAGVAQDERYPIRVVRIGELEIASGRVVLCDPFSMSARDEPLALHVPPGRYPVDLAVADTGKSGHRVALARLLLSPAPAIRWLIAVTKEQDAATLKGDDVFG